VFRAQVLLASVHVGTDIALYVVQLKENDVKVSSPYNQEVSDTGLAQH
jgi:sRNA-binding carbon storage regulator CsrA